MKGIIKTGLFTLLVLSVFVVAGSAYAETITVAGTGANQEMLRAVAKSFMAVNPGITVEVPDSIGSGGAVKAAGEGKVELGRVARKIKDKEKVYGLEYLGFARMPLVFVANSSVTGIPGLTAGQTVDIFTGKVVNWNEIGGPKTKIRVVTRYEGDSTLKMLITDLPGWADLKVTERSKSTETDQENASLLKETEGAVGYATLNIAMANGLTVFNLDGRSPQSADYPLAMEFGLVYKPGQMTGAVKKFVDYLFSDDAASAIKNSGGVAIAR